MKRVVAVVWGLVGFQLVKLLKPDLCLVLWSKNKTETKFLVVLFRKQLLKLSRWFVCSSNKALKLIRLEGFQQDASSPGVNCDQL